VGLLSRCGLVLGALVFLALPSSSLAQTTPTMLANEFSSDFEVRPANVAYTGDGTAVLGGRNGTPGTGDFGRLHWRHWRRRGASAVGVDWLNNCRPDCARGSFRPHPVALHLDRVRHARFTRMVIRFRHRPTVERLRLSHNPDGFFWI